MGYRKKGVYTIDIDRNGPLPPAHVYCDMGEDSGHSIVTRVENNMPPEMVCDEDYIFYTFLLNYLFDFFLLFCHSL